ncbi:MAG: TonB family protein [Syntrophobacteraceae bacterium]
MNGLEVMEPLEPGDVSELFSEEVRLDLEAVSELFSLQTSRDSILFSSNKGLLPAEPRSWSSLALALLVHSFLFAVFLATGGASVPVRHDRIQVQLMELPGGSEGKGGGGAKPLLQPTGRGEPEAATHSPPSAKPAPVRLPPTKEAQTLQKKIVHPVKVVEKTRRVAVRKSIGKKKMVRAKTAIPEETHRSRQQSFEPAQQAGSAAPENARGAHATGTGVVPGAGPGRSGGPAAGAAHGPGGNGGALEVGFGSANGPRFLHRVVPSYPAFARAQQMQGTVVLSLLIDRHGRVVSVTVLKKAGFGFDEAAVKAIRQSTFFPARNNGKPCRCKVVIPVRFEME